MKKAKESPVKGRNCISSFFKILKPDDPKLKDTTNITKNDTAKHVKVESEYPKPKVGGENGYGKAFENGQPKLKVKQEIPQAADPKNDICLKLNVVSNNAKRKRSEDQTDAAVLQLSKEKVKNVQEEIKLLDDMLEVDSSIFGDFEPWGNEVPSVSGDLKLDTLTRCKVENVEKQDAGSLLVTLKSPKDGSSALCKIMTPWSSCPINVGNVVSVRARQAKGQWVVDGSCLLVLNSDHLITGTSVVGALFCMRKSILSNMFKDASSSSVMVIGSLAHELLQEVLKQKLHSLADITKLYREIVSKKEFIMRLYSENMEYDKVLEELSLFIPKIHDFVQTYIQNNRNVNSFNKEKDSNQNWTGSISEIKDIEECIWLPSLGLKGKIDATVQVKIHKTSKIMPLELKTGRASFSSEHCGQVILYCMLLNHLGHSVDSGLLLYLREGIMREVKAGEAEKRDLILLRNQLSHWLAKCIVPKPVGPPELPPPINHHSACSKCSYLTICSSALRQDGLSSVTGNNPLKKLVPEVTSHLTDAHIEYVFKFINLLFMDRSQDSVPIWSESAEARESKGAGLSNLGVAEVIQKGNRFETTFTKIDKSEMKTSVFSNGQYVIVNSDERYGISAGFISSALTSSLTVLLDRDLSNGTGPFHVDRIETSTQYNIPLSNLSLLLEDSPKAARLRDWIIDLKVPKFAPKLSSKINKIGKPIFERLNRDQIRALLQVLAAEDYILIKGMPGTGKTSTLVALIELLTHLGKTVLVTSYTHSALDNILLGLVGKVDFLRLGSTGRIHPDIVEYSEEVLSSPENYRSSDELDRLYKSKPVVGVTCLGAWHFLFNKRSFDVCIVDEATQVHQPVILKPLFSAAKFVLIGDPDQLSPLVLNNEARDTDLGVSLFERLNRPAVTSLLTLQYRMNGSLTRLANCLTYNGLLKCGSSKVENASLDYADVDTKNWPEWLKLCLSKEPDRSVVVMDVKNSRTDDPEKLNVNLAEADIVLQILRKIKQVGVRGQDVGVMSPYKNQVEHIQKEASEIDSGLEIRTIDQYQGRDKKVIIYSCTRFTNPTANDIMNVPSRLTVAVTRAKVKLILIGNVDLLRSYSSYNKLFNSIPESNFFKIS